MRFVFAVLLLIAANSQAMQREEIRKYGIKKATVVTESGTPPTFSTKVVNEYDREGNLVRSLGYGSSTNAALTTSTYRHDSKGRVIDSDSDGDRQLNEWTYGPLGLPTEVKSYTPQRVLKQRQTAKYNSDGKIAEEVSYDASGSVLTRATYGYDARGNLVEFKSSTADTALKFRKTHRYDASDMVIESKSFDASGRTTSRESFKYDGMHLREQDSFQADGTLSQRLVMKRDSRGFVKETSTFNSTGQLTGRTYTTLEFY